MSIFPVINGRITDYDVVVVGHLRWNRYFGESEKDPPRGQPSTCTSTLIRGLDAQGNEYRLVVDPTQRENATDYYFDLNRRTGLSASAITHCYVTHEHMDHQAGLAYFPGAVWLAAPAVAEALRTSPAVDGRRVVPVEGEFLPGLYTLPLPGHTLSLHGLALRADGKRVIVAGDSVMTKHHFRHNTGEFEKDKELAAQTILRLKESADLVIPGHDNLIVL